MLKDSCQKAELEFIGAIDLKAIVHIGTEKTGTSSIQRFLYQNQKSLKGAGFHFLQSAGKMNNREIPAYCISDDRYDDYFRSVGITTHEGKLQFKQSFINKFENEIRSLSKNVHTVVISSEHFHSRIRSEEELDNVYNLLSAYFDEIKIVCYLREQVSMCTSFYSTHMRNSGTESLSKFLQRCHPGNYYFNYYEMLENWGRCFGFESLDVSLFSPAQFLNRDLLDDFTAKLDAKLVGRLNKLVDAENESLRPLGQALARAINIALPLTSERNDVIDMRTRSKRIIVERLTGKGQQPGLRVRQRIYRSFLDCNEKLREKYFPTIEGLFEPPVEEVLPGTAISKQDFDVLADILNIFKKYGLGEADTDVYTNIVAATFSCVNDATLSEMDSNEIDREILLSDKDADLFRVAAKRMENENLGAAIRLMSLANDLRPNWTAIKLQLEKYRKEKQKVQMSRFLIAYYGGPTAMTSDVIEIYKRFDAWLASLAVPFGSHFIVVNDTRTVTGGGMLVEDANARMGGYSIVEGESISAVLSLVESCPFLEMDGLVRVSQLQFLTGGW